jgi:5-formyltetrahydrofolate cyclo-ligase
MSDAPNPALQSANSQPSVDVDTVVETVVETGQDMRNELRKKLSSTRRQLSDVQVLEYSSVICHKLLSLIKPSTNIGGYLAVGNEVRIDPALDTARQRLCKTYVPIIQSDHQMVFAQIDDDMTLVKNKFGILEPDLAISTCILSGSLDAVLVPLVGFDEQCQRMGMGGGFYDRAFAENKHLQDEVTKPLLIGVAYDIQQTASVLPDWWDVPLDVIVTETRILRRRPSSQ